MKYPKSYSVKEWKKFNKVLEFIPDDPNTNRPYQFFNFLNKRYESYDHMTMQEVMINKFDITLTDHKTKKEKVFEIIDKVNIKNLNAGIDKFNKGVNQFSKVIASSQPKGKKTKIKIGMSQREYNELFGPKRKGNTMSFWDEDKKTRKRRNKKSKPVQKEKHMPFYGSKKVKFF